jgi:GxxExxY protein
MSSFQPDDTMGNIGQASFYAAASSSSGNAMSKINQEINTLSDLDSILSSLVSTLHQTLGPRNTEAMYQRALILDLTELGLCVESEVSINVLYKGSVVGKRRCDLIVTCVSGEKAIFELKATKEATTAHLNQLEYYLQSFGIGTGYLINFPHEAGFPDHDDDDGFSAHFDLLTVNGDNRDLISNAERDARANERRRRTKTKDSEENRYFEDPQILKVIRREGGRSTQEAEEEDEEEEGGTTKKKAPSVQSNAYVEITFGVTKAGTPCKVCLKQRTYCNMHRSQKPS